MPVKPAKSSLRIFVFVDAILFYLHNLESYVEILETSFNVSNKLVDVTTPNNRTNKR